MNTGKVALGVLAAAATGAALGMLFAPAKGAALRRKIYRAGEKDVEMMKDKVSDVVDNLTNKFEKVKENVTGFAQKTMTKTEGEVNTAAN
jgi:gas vesicle protein